MKKPRKKYWKPKPLKKMKRDELENTVMAYKELATFYRKEYIKIRNKIIKIIE